MLLADHGARVTRIEPPGGDPFGAFSGSRVWARGKRSALLDLTEPGQRNVVLELASRADVVVESFAPGVTQDLGVDYETLCAKNDRLVYCSITGYGADGQHADRPGYDMLVAARTGQQWEHRGIVGGTIEKLAGGEGMMPGLVPPDEECWAVRFGMVRWHRACRGRAWPPRTWPRWRSAPRCASGSSAVAARRSRRHSCRASSPPRLPHGSAQSTIEVRTTNRG